LVTGTRVPATVTAALGGSTVPKTSSFRAVIVAPSVGAVSETCTAGGGVTALWPQPVAAAPQPMSAHPAKARASNVLENPRRVCICPP
jgi:hypothetical protein